MVFLIEYNRTSGLIVTMKSFDDSDREMAQEARLELELQLNARDVENEVVLLEALNEDAVRRTHRRYFENLRELTTAPAS